MRNVVSEKVYANFQSNLINQTVLTAAISILKSVLLWPCPTPPNAETRPCPRMTSSCSFFTLHHQSTLSAYTIHSYLIYLDTKRSHDANNPSLASPPPWVSTLQIKSRLNSNFKFYNNNIDVNRTFLPQVFTPFLLHFLNIELSARAEQPPKSLLRPQ